MSSKKAKVATPRNMKIRNDFEKLELTGYYADLCEQFQYSSDRLVGHIMEVIEILGLPEQQSKATKGRIKEIIYDTHHRFIDYLRDCHLVEGQFEAYEKKILGHNS